MSKMPVWIDTDGQLDSFWGLILANRFLDVKAVSVCTGKNVSFEQACRNTAGFTKMAGLSCALYKGSERSVLNKEKKGLRRFAPDGKCGLPVPEAGAMYEETPVWDALYEMAKAETGELTVLCFGPMTNLAISIFKHPDICGMIKKVAFVGGSYDFGNVAATVEENMAADPEAARAVFQSGIKMEMYGYNLELKSAFTNAEIGRIVDGANGPYTTAFAMGGMSHRPGEPVYYGPALAAMGLGMPEAITFQRHNIFIETKSDICRGRVVPLTMYTPLGYAKDTKVAMDLDKEAYVRIMKETLASYEAIE